MCAARAREVYEQQAKERLNTKGGHSGPVNLPEAKADARDAAGKAFGVSGKSVDFAKKVIDKGIPEKRDRSRSLNDVRRHLTESQRAMRAGRVSQLKHGTNRYEEKVDGSRDPSRNVTAEEAAREEVQFCTSSFALC